MVTQQPRPEQTQLSFDDLTTLPADETTTAILELVHGDHIHTRDREAICTAILAVGRTHAGRVDPNLVREQLPVWVFPRSVGATYSALARMGVLEPDGWVASTDLKGRNRGRPIRYWRLVEPLTPEGSR